MELGHLLTHSSLTYPEVSSVVYHDSFCQLGSSVSDRFSLNDCSIVCINIDLCCLHSLLDGLCAVAEIISYDTQHVKCILS